MFMPDRGVKRYFARNEKRQQHQRYATLCSAQHLLDGGATAKTEAQKDDTSLANIKEAVKNENSDFLMYIRLFFR